MEYHDFGEYFNGIGIVFNYICFHRNLRIKKLYDFASIIALITIRYNIIEGAVSVFFGLEDGSMALFGFGVASFVEVISGIGIWHMVRRMVY